MAEKGATVMFEEQTLLKYTYQQLYAITFLWRNV